MCRRRWSSTCARRSRHAACANVEVVHAGVPHLPHAAPPADFVFTRNALHQVPDFWKAIALDRIRRILKRRRDPAAQRPRLQLRGRPRPRSGWRRGSPAPSARTTRPTAGWPSTPHRHARRPHRRALDNGGVSHDSGTRTTATDPVFIRKPGRTASFVGAPPTTSSVRAGCRPHLRRPPRHGHIGLCRNRPTWHRGRRDPGRSHPLPAIANPSHTLDARPGGRSA